VADEESAPRRAYITRTPSGSRQFKLLEPGEPFLFKLHSPRNFIVGGGFFVRHTALPCSLAWSAFGVKNGVADAVAFAEGGA
jgi:putative restriction endonuclease